MQKFARESIKQLFEQAINLSRLHQLDKANKAIKQALRIARKYNIRISNLNKMYKRLFCKKCFHILIPDKTVRIRVDKKRIMYKCLKCGHIKRYPYVKNKKVKRKD